MAIYSCPLIDRVTEAEAIWCLHAIEADLDRLADFCILVKTVNKGWLS